MYICVYECLYQQKPIPIHICIYLRSHTHTYTCILLEHLTHNIHIYIYFDTYTLTTKLAKPTTCTNKEGGSIPTHSQAVLTFPNYLHLSPFLDSSSSHNQSCWSTPMYARHILIWEWNILTKRSSGIEFPNPFHNHPIFSPLPASLKLSQDPFKAH